MLQRIAGFLYGVVCYLVFLVTFVYAIGFIGNFLVPKSIDSVPMSSLSMAVLTNSLLLGLFALQHSIMARQWFKQGLARIIPTPVERSTYVLFSSLALLLMFWKWEPIGGNVWSIENALGQGVMITAYAFGWITVFVTTCLINHFDLFGMRQVWFYLQGRPYEPIGFRTPWLYRYVRHPLYVGWLLVFWTTPTMTAAHLLFAVMTTGYILVAIQFEERDLRKFHREYDEYARKVPMLVPALSRREGNESESAGEAAAV